jgi:acetylornithine/succinyldiaminopimelate/putrescine aminotransferase
MDVASATLAEFTPELRANIAARGHEFIAKLEALKNELPAGYITGVQGTGLLFSCEIATHYKCHGTNSTEEFIREKGINVIHGGINSLRFTPVFALNTEEVDLVIDAVRQALLYGPRMEEAAAA